MILMTRFGRLRLRSEEWGLQLRGAGAGEGVWGGDGVFFLSLALVDVGSSGICSIYRI